MTFCRKTSLLLLTLLLLFASSACAEIDTPSLLAPATHFVTMQDTLYFIANGTLYAWAGGDAQPEPLGDVPAGTLLTDGERLYTLHNTTGVLSTLALKEGGCAVAKTLELSWADMELDEDHRQIVGAAITPESLFLLQLGYDSFTNDLLQIDLSSGRVRVTEVTDIQAIAAYRDGTLLTASYSFTDVTKDAELAVYDPDARTTEPLGTLAFYPDQIVYDAAQDRIFLPVSNTLYRWLPDEEPLLVARIGENNSAAMLGDVCIVKGYESTKAVAISPNGVEIQTLTIGGGNSLPDSILEAFAERYPDVQINERGRGSKDYLTEILSNTNAADLYTFTLPDETYYDLVNKGYLASLSGVPAIQTAVSQMYPQLASTMTSPGGEIVAVPFDVVYARGWQMYNAALWTELDISPLPETIDDLMDALCALAERNDLLDEGYQFFDIGRDSVTDMKRYLLRLILDVYINAQGNELAFDTPEFAKLMEKYEACIPAMEKLCAKFAEYHGDSPDSDIIDSRSLISTRNGSALLPYYPSSHNPKSHPQYLALALEEGREVRLPLSIKVMVVNASSPKVDLALEFAAFIAKNMSNQAKINYYPAHNQPILREDYEEEKAYYQQRIAEYEAALQNASDNAIVELEAKIHGYEEDLIDLEAHKWDVRDTDVAEYLAWVDHMVVVKNTRLNINSGASPELNRLFNQYLEGSITTNMFITRYSQMAQMILAEQQ